MRNSIVVLVSRPSRSLLKTAKSKLFTPSERNVGSTRDSLPNVKFAGAEKQEALNQAFKRDDAPPADTLSHPAETFGREPAPNSVASLACPFANTRGNPF